MAEDFANSKGFSIAIKTDVTEEMNSQYFGDSDNSQHSIHNESVEKEIHNQGYTYVRPNSFRKSKIVGRIKRDISGKGWDRIEYRNIKIELGNKRDFSESNKLHKIKGPLDIENEKNKN